ncbi:sigma-70 family RNA polymerase sigma factor [Bacillus sp. FJAT-29790]|uniref:sigma-70 family RNA polymerase sigma factor n=1 Tax=Bacillus sp. FJAT-29790 TaxID=1895002 RepID=UPI001C2199E1|nr:sigma-70 family RNA polymerase sigma factor [Bacillus sp. FJAT-29790]MBU8880461.1 sigma-70 family RNA polymerase sigma factor [Bacillus sp. FJAT-29790]
MVFSENDVLLAQSGDQEAFMRLINNCENSLYRVAKGILKGDMECADAIQESLLKSYQSISKLKNPHYFKTWLIRILINECNDILKKKKRNLPLKGVESIVDQQSDKKGFDELSAAISELNDKYRSVVVLFYFEECSIKEIAEILKIREGTVKSRLNRARSMLATCLNEANEERGAENGPFKN